MALSAVTGSALSFTTPPTLDSSEGGPVRITIISDFGSAKPAIDSSTPILTDGIVVIDFRDTPPIGGTLGTIGGLEVDPDGPITQGWGNNGGIQPMPIPPAEDGRFPAEGGTIATIAWPMSGLTLAPDTGDEPTRLADSAAESPLDEVLPVDSASEAERQVEGQRGRAMVFEVAATTTSKSRFGGRSLAHESPAADDAPGPIAFREAASSDRAAAVDAVYASHGHDEIAAQRTEAPVDLAAKTVVVLDSVHASDGVARSGVGRVAADIVQSVATETAAYRSASVELGEVNRSTVALLRSESSRDKAWEEHGAESTWGHAAALLDPARNRPILGLMVASILLTTHSLSISRPQADRSPVELRPRRRTSQSD